MSTHKYDKVRAKKMRKAYSIKIECICPKCGVHHKMKINWTGKGIPKMFCNECRHYVESIDYNSRTGNKVVLPSMRY